MRILSDLWSGFRQPSPRNPDPHHRGATGFWHFGLGVVPGGLLALAGWESPVAAALVISSGYFLTKEVPDLRRGGDLADGIEDALFVGMGAAAGVVAPIAAAVMAPAHLAALTVMWAQISTGSKRES